MTNITNTDKVFFIYNHNLPVLPPKPRHLVLIGIVVVQWQSVSIIRRVTMLVYGVGLGD